MDISVQEEISSIFKDIFEGRENGTLKIWIRHAEILLKNKAGDLKNRCMTAEDIVHEIICRTIEGKRKWDRKRVPNLNTYMWGQISSLVDSETRKAVRFTYPEPDENAGKKAAPVILEEIPDYSVPDIGEDTDAAALEKKCLKLLEDDPAALKVFNEMMKGSKNREIVEDLGLSYKDVVNAKRRLQEKLRGILTG